MERALEASVRVQAEPKRVVEILCSDPPGILTGRPARDTEAFAAELAVDLGGGVSLVDSGGDLQITNRTARDLVGVMVKAPGQDVA